MPISDSTLIRLQHQAEVIDTILTGMSDWQLQNRLDEEKWSIHEHLAHLGRYQEIFFERIQMIRQGDTPYFSMYRAEMDAEFPSWQNSATDDVLDQIKILRRELYRLIGSFTEDDLINLGGHSKFGLMNVSSWCEFFLLHEAHHLLKVFELVYAWKNINT
jgi:uncharacterized damage-inducible protein DinB